MLVQLGHELRCLVGLDVSLQHGYGRFQCIRPKVPTSAVEVIDNRCPQSKMPIVYDRNSIGLNVRPLSQRAEDVSSVHHLGYIDIFHRPLVNDDPIPIRPLRICMELVANGCVEPRPVNVGLNGDHNPFKCGICDKNNGHALCSSLYP